MSRTGEIVYLRKKADIKRNSTIKYYDDGAKLFEAEKEALKSAKNFIFLEFFIVKSGKVLSEVIDILCERANAGVKIYFLYDAVGSLNRIKKSDKERLKKSGVRFESSVPLRGKWLRYANNRDHRKIIIVDDEIAFTGGVNLSDEYTHEKECFGYWKDSGLSLKGEIVPDFSDIFIDMWNSISGKKITLLHEEKTKKRKTGYDVAIFTSTPKNKSKERIAKNIYINTINSAKKSLYISTPYLVCDAEVLNSLALAAGRGVKVVLVAPKISDKPLVCKFGRATYKYLIDSGVEIYEFTPGIIHGKNLVKDGQVSISGTINFDYRSFDIDYECAVWTNSKSFSRSLMHDFREIIKKSERISSNTYKETSPILKLFTPIKKQF